MFIPNRPGWGIEPFDDAMKAHPIKIGGLLKTFS